MDRYTSFNVRCDEFEKFLNGEEMKNYNLISFVLVGEIFIIVGEKRDTPHK